MVGKMGRKAIKTRFSGEAGCDAGRHWKGEVLAGMGL